MVKNKKKVLILGGTGFLGNEISMLLNQRGLDVYSVSNIARDKKNETAGIKYIYLQKKDYQKSIFNKKSYDYIINLIGYVDHSRFFQGGHEVIKNHLFLPINLVSKLNLENTKTILNISSSDEYGMQKPPQTEVSREDPLSPYAFSKTALNYFFQMIAKTEDISVLNLRPFLIYGPGQKTNRVIPYLIEAARQNKKINLDSGSFKRDFLYIGDFLKAIEKALAYKKGKGEVINIASGTPVNINEVSKIIINKLNSKSEIINSNKNIKSRIQNTSLYADITRAKKILNWTPKISLEQGIIRTIDYYLD
tara:strand:+ start:3278 stop:4198 length:921 start_codon:yes stop_codon:yes gene_type:complete